MIESSPQISVQPLHNHPKVEDDPIINPIINPIPKIKIETKTEPEIQIPILAPQNPQNPQNIVRNNYIFVPTYAVPVNNIVNNNHYYIMVGPNTLQSNNFQRHQPMPGYCNYNDLMTRNVFPNTFISFNGKIS